MPDQHVLRIPARDIAQLLQTRRHGPLEMRLVELAADVKKNSGRGPFVLWLDFPGEPTGGFTLQCRKPGLLARLGWWLSQPVQLWDD